MASLGIQADDETWEALVGEYEEADAQINAGSGDRPTTKSYSLEWAAGTESAFLLYTIVRIQRPRTILETGVANGRSTAAVLAALTRNGFGELISTDLDPAAGMSVPEAWRARWRLEVVTSHAQRQFGVIVRDIRNLEMFIHDSLHEYGWQRIEYSTVLEKMSAGGIIAADDAHGCYAFLDLCRGLRTVPVILLDHDKVFGVTRIGS